MKKVLIILLVVYSTMVFSDATLNGVVKDQNNNPLPGVSVFVVRSSIPGLYSPGDVYIDYTAVTDNNGAYSISIPYGSIEHEVANGQDISHFFFEFEGQSIQLEFGSSQSVPYRWNDAGGRILNCGFGCRVEPTLSNEIIELGTGNFSLTLSDVTLDTSLPGVAYSGTVSDEDGKAVANPNVLVEANVNSSFKTSYFPAVSQVNGSYQSFKLPSGAEILVSSNKEGYVKTYHGGTQCNPSVFCRPADSAPSLVNDFVLVKAARLEINRPSYPSGINYFFRDARLYDSYGRALLIRNCEVLGDQNSIPAGPCVFDNLLPNQTYHVIYVGWDNNGELKPKIREFHSGETLGCGSHWNPENFPTAGIILNTEQPTTLDFPVQAIEARFGCSRP